MANLPPQYKQELEEQKVEAKRVFNESELKKEKDAKDVKKKKKQMVKAKIHPKVISN